MPLSSAAVGALQRSLDDVALDDVALDDVARDDVALDDVARDDVARDDVALDDVALDDVALDDLGSSMTWGPQPVLLLPTPSLRALRATALLSMAMLVLVLVGAARVGPGLVARLNTGTLTVALTNASWEPADLRPAVFRNPAAVRGEWGVTEGVLKYEGQPVSVPNAGLHLWDVAGLWSNSVVAVGEQGLILRRSPSGEWRASRLGGGALRVIALGLDGKAYAAGEGGRLVALEEPPRVLVPERARGFGSLNILALRVVEGPAGRRFLADARWSTVARGWLWAGVGAVLAFGLGLLVTTIRAVGGWLRAAAASRCWPELYLQGRAAPDGCVTMTLSGPVGQYCVAGEVAVRLSVLRRGERRVVALYAVEAVQTIPAQPADDACYAQLRCRPHAAFFVAQGEPDVEMEARVRLSAGWAKQYRHGRVVLWTGKEAEGGRDSTAERAESGPSTVA